MKFSIVVPAFNAEKYIEKCIESVINQTYSDWELIIVNDGSFDNTENIIHAISKTDNRIILFNQENKGEYFAREQGIKLCSGDFIVFLDSDDRLKSDCLSAIFNEVDKNNYDILLYTGDVVTEDGSTTGKIVGYIDSTKKEISNNWLKEQLIKSDTYNSIWLKAFKRSLFDNDPTDYSSLIGTHCGGDKIRIFFPITNASKIGYIPDSLYSYTLRGDSIMHTVKLETVDRMMCIEMFEQLHSFMDKWKMNDTKHKNDFVVYFIRNFLNVYYGVRKSLNNSEEKKKFRRIDWKGYLKKSPIYYLVHYFKYFSTKEIINLLAAALHL